VTKLKYKLLCDGTPRAAFVMLRLIVGYRYKTVKMSVHEDRGKDVVVVAAAAAAAAAVVVTTTMMMS